MTIKQLKPDEKIDSKQWIRVVPFDPKDKKVTIQMGSHTSKEHQAYLFRLMEQIMDTYGPEVTINIETNVKPEDAV